MTSRSPALLVFVLGVLGVGGCDPLDEGPPARYATSPEPEADEPGSAPAPAAPSDDGKYASAEVPIGEDKDVYDDNDPAALSDFRSALDPYGKWVDDPKYGTVWEPNHAAVGDDFVPYKTAGHWVYDDDYVWASDYPWGWAPFHYGRWVYIEGTGWAWVPGRQYRGAWVEWGVDPAYAYVGWYPMAPAFLWFGGLAVGYGFYVGPTWAYCPRGYVFAPNVGARVLAGPAVGPVAARVTGYVGAAPGVGPAPSRLGYTAAAVPHTAPGAAGGGVAQAQQFARPSTAVAAGAHAPTPVASASASASASAASRGSLTSGTTRGAAATASSSSKKGEPEATTPRKRAGSGYRGGSHPTFAPSSGFHGGGGGGHGGGGHR